MARGNTDPTVECFLLLLLFSQPTTNTNTHTHAHPNTHPQGYQSLHTGVFLMDGGGTAEVQIRTKTMHEEAEYGGASHALYKVGMGVYM